MEVTPSRYHTDCKSGGFYLRLTFNHGLLPHGALKWSNTDRHQVKSNNTQNEVQNEQASQKEIFKAVQAGSGKVGYRTAISAISSGVLRLLSVISGSAPVSSSVPTTSQCPAFTPYISAVLSQLSWWFNPAPAASSCPTRDRRSSRTYRHQPPYRDNNKWVVATNHL